MKRRHVTIFVDGAVAGGRYSGVAAVARTPEGYFLGWASRRLATMTNNEAEYQAALLGLELAARLDASVVEIVSDSETVVFQMQGRSRVNSSGLKPLHKDACVAVRHFKKVNFRHVGREENQLADALAAEAITGRVVRMRPRRRSPIRKFLGR